MPKGFASASKSHSQRRHVFVFLALARYGLPTSTCSADIRLLGALLTFRGGANVGLFIHRGHPVAIMPLACQWRSSVAKCRASHTRMSSSDSVPGVQLDLVKHPTHPSAQSSIRPNSTHPSLKPPTRIGLQMKQPPSMGCSMWMFRQLLALSRHRHHHHHQQQQQQQHHNHHFTASIYAWRHARGRGPIWHRWGLGCCRGVKTQYTNQTNLRVSKMKDLLGEDLIRPWFYVRRITERQSARPAISLSYFLSPSGGSQIGRRPPRRNRVRVGTSSSNVHTCLYANWF